MINKLLKYTVIIFIILFYNSNIFSSDDVLIDAEIVDIKDSGDLILASGKVTITDVDNIKIVGDKAKYNRLTQSIEIIGNVIFSDKEKNYEVKSDKIIFNRNGNIISTFGNTRMLWFNKDNNKLNFEIESTNAIFDRNKKILEVNEKVVLKDPINQYLINSNKIIYYNTSEEVKSFGITKINIGEKYFVNTKDISYSRKTNIFNTKAKTQIEDVLENKFDLSSFNFDLEKNILRAKEIIISDNQNNVLELSDGFIDFNSNELVGANYSLNLNKGTFGNTENDPRLFGRYLISNKLQTNMKKSVFTTCKKREGKCPAWSISADEVTFKKEKKRIEYKNAWLEIYDLPVAYFPYFFHPDPTVKRQSGFLFPQFINNNNLGFSTLIPYFVAIDEDKDMTITPRVYTNNNLFIQTEYRQQFKNSYFITDFSFNKKDSSNSHFFATMESDLEDSFYEVKIETVSNKDYLKKYQIQSPLVKNYSVLNSSLTLEKYSDDYNFSSSINLIEDLSKIESDKYEYVFPSYSFNKENELNSSLFDKFNINSSGSYRKYNTNIDEVDIVNDFVFNSNNQDKLSAADIDFNIILKNINSYGDLSSSYKEGQDYRLLSGAVFDAKYPLFKEKNNNKSYLTPRISLRYSPNQGTNLINEKSIVSYKDMFLLERINNKTLESGFSSTLGLEYKNLNNLNDERFNFGLAVNFRDEEDFDLPKSSSLGQKTSDIFGYSGLNITENLSLGYDFIIDQNLNESNYSLISADYNGKSFETSFKYMEKSNLIGDESYLKNYTQLEINKSNSIAFETSKNIDKNLTNYYDLIYKYKNDCLEASLVYNKQFYSESSINSGKNIFFKISFIPFGTINTPNLNDK